MSRATTAFVIGNGTSRRSIDLHQLKRNKPPDSKIYGCNALYREFEPDYLVAVDSKMVMEINRSGWQLHHEVWTNPNKAYKDFNKFNYFDPSLGWSTGPTTLNLASEESHNNQDIYILGFDYEGLNNKVNNIYANTENYKTSDATASYHGNWARQTGIVIQKNPTKRYIRVALERDSFLPDNLKVWGNLHHMTVQEFKDLFRIL